MSFWKRLFGLFGKRGSKPPAGDTRAAPRASATPQLVNQGTGDPPIKVDPRTITHAFVALTHDDLSKSNALGTKVIDLNKDCEPRLWSTEIKVKCASFALDRGAARNGFPDLRGVGPALEKLGLTAPYTIVAHAITVPAGGSSGTKVLVGFAHRDPAHQLVLTEKDRCVPNWTS
ncbi:MAG TPA: hypothetical protein VFT55_17175 [Planctomycetota bacterium]|nr:hypothetical protein [Planctomycetota bacterium]